MCEGLCFASNAKILTKRRALEQFSCAFCHITEREEFLLQNGEEDFGPGDYREMRWTLLKGGEKWGKSFILISLWRENFSMNKLQSCTLLLIIFHFSPWQYIAIVLLLFSGGIIFPPECVHKTKKVHHIDCDLCFFPVWIMKVHKYIIFMVIFSLFNKEKVGQSGWVCERGTWILVENCGKLHYFPSIKHSLSPQSSTPFQHKYLRGWEQKGPEKKQ